MTLCHIQINASHPPVDHTPIILVASFLHLHFEKAVCRILGDFERLCLRHRRDGEHGTHEKVANVAAVVHVDEVHV